uniref:Uncharacterized protein n=1 Tax=Melanopsichium pennsylvanicum 4 TaxID=1398559 RepID=A0A077R1F0_9BASI|nr:uncharacterized protein BN887_06070 [Melanopsichium pennsylvanicum 4]
MVFNRLDEDKDGEMTVGSRGAVLDSGGVIDVGAVLIKEGSGDCDAVLVDEGGDGMAPFDGEEAGGKVMSNESSGSGSDELCDSPGKLAFLELDTRRFTP